MARAAADASVFHAIADPTRRTVLDLLRDGELAVSMLLERIRTSQSALSQHLAVLRRAGLVRQRRFGRHRLYRVEPAPLREVVDWIAEYDKFWTTRLDNLGAYLDRTSAPPRASEKRHAPGGLRINPAPANVTSPRPSRGHKQPRTRHG